MTTLILDLKDLINNGIVTTSTIEIDLDAKLAERRQIAIIWDIEDVNEVRPDLTEQQAFEVLENVKRHHDATIGINWDTLQCVADELFGEPSPKSFGE